MKIILILFIIILLFCLDFENFEKFVESNSYDIPENDLVSPYHLMIKEFDEKLNLPFEKSNLPFDKVKDDYTLLNDNIKFEYNSNVKNVVLNYLKKLYPSDKIYIHGDAFKVYFKNDSFILNVNFVNMTSFFSTILTVKLKKEEQTDKFEIISIKSNNSRQNFTFKSANFYPNYYEFTRSK